MTRKQYRSLAKEKLRQAICNKCKTKLPAWDNDIYKCWLRYLEGKDRDELIQGTRFSLYVSPKYHFKEHSCYRKIAGIRKKLFRKVRTTVKMDPIKFPWLLGIFYADGSLHTGSQLSFSLAKHEKIIADEVVKQLKAFLDNPHIVVEDIGNMINVRIHSVELCDSFPKKGDSDRFETIWKKYSDPQKLEFIAGFVDGDGSCAFEDNIDSIGVYSKSVPFLLERFRSFLRRFGYVSLKECKLYISPCVGRVIKERTLKRLIRKPYYGSVDTRKCYELLKRGLSIRKIAKRSNLDKKTILIALRRVYGNSKIENYVSKHRKTKLTTQKI